MVQSTTRGGVTIYPLGGDPSHLPQEDLDRWVQERRDCDAQDQQERSEAARRALYEKLKGEFEVKA